MAELDDSVNFAVYQTLDEVLLEVITQCEAVRHAETPLALKVHLVMASRALRCAMEIYGLFFEVPKSKEPE